MRRFELHRDEDETGVSGTGVVVEGVVFSDGSAAMRWVVGEHRSAVFWPAPAVEAIEAIHGHGGRTRLVWVDDDPDAPCGFCGGTGWVTDEGWSPEYREQALASYRKTPGDGIVPCGRCGDWDAPWPGDDE